MMAVASRMAWLHVDGLLRLAVGQRTLATDIRSPISVLRPAMPRFRAARGRSRTGRLVTRIGV